MDNLPKLEFRYSKPYDREITKARGKEFNKEKVRSNYDSFIQEFKSHWTKEKEKDILKTMSNCTGLQWKKRVIPVYFVNHLEKSAFSKPLTIQIGNNYILICETLTHELAHRILTQNRESTQDIFNRLKELYPEEKHRTRLHILVCAITRRVFTEVFGEESYQEAYREISRYKGLKKPLEILEELYPKLGENILDSILQM